MYTPIQKAEELKRELKHQAAEFSGSKKETLLQMIQQTDGIIRTLKDIDLVVPGIPDPHEITKRQVIGILTTNSNPFMTLEDLEAPNNQYLINLCIRFSEKESQEELGQLLTKIRKDGSIKNKHAYLTKILKNMLKEVA